MSTRLRTDKRRGFLALSADRLPIQLSRPCSGDGARQPACHHSGVPPLSPPQLSPGVVPDRDLEAAASLTTAPEELARLAVDPNGGIRSRVAANPACPPPLLPRIATDHSALVRRRVAANPSTPLAVLRALARERDATVRGQVGAHPAAPADALRRLGHDRAQ
jgi:hypothetical protein